MRITIAAMLGVAWLLPAVAASAEPVGLVNRLQNTAYGTPPELPRNPKQPADGVEHHELIETARNSAIEIGFIDGTDLTIGADANVLIDEFIFDSNAGTGSALINLAKGAFRWSTGVMPAESVTIETPTATITIRGTLLKIGVRPNGNSIVALIAGLATVRAKGSNQTADLLAGQTALVTPDGIEVSDEIASVADAIVDGGWERAQNYRTGLGRDRDRDGSNGSGNY